MTSASSSRCPNQSSIWAAWAMQWTKSDKGSTRRKSKVSMRPILIFRIRRSSIWSRTRFWCWTVKHWRKQMSKHRSRNNRRIRLSSKSTTSQSWRITLGYLVGRLRRPKRLAWDSLLTWSKRKTHRAFMTSTRGLAIRWHSWTRYMLKQLSYMTLPKSKSLLSRRRPSQSNHYRLCLLQKLK